MEMYGVQPDIRVDNSPEDNLAGRDRQLEIAVDDLMKQLVLPGGILLTRNRNKLDRCVRQ